MERTREGLGNLVNYEAVIAISPLAPPLIERGTIPEFIHCPRYKRAKGVGFINCVTPDHSDPASVERYNEAVEEAREKLEQLNTEALAEIDNDMVAFLGQCLQTAARLGESQHPQELLAALETCFLALKTHHAFEQHINSNVPRRQARQHISEIGQLLAELCGNQALRIALQDILHRNAMLIETNADLCSQVMAAVGAVSQDDIETMAQSFQRAFSENFRAQHSYSGLVGPAKLETTVRQARQAIDSINHSISRIRELFESSRTLAEAALAAHHTSQILLSAMKTKVAELGDARLGPGHFVQYLIDQPIIEELLTRELRPAAAGVRDYLVEAIGEQKLNTFLKEHHDSYSIARAEAAIQQANLLRLQISRDQVEGHIKKLSEMVQELKNQVQKARAAPAQNGPGSVH